MEIKPQLLDVNGLPGQESPAIKVVQQVGAKAVQAAGAIVDMGRQTVENIDARRGPVAKSLEQTASVLDRRTDTVAAAAHTTADTLRATAGFVRENDLKAMTTHVGNFVRRHPVKVLLGVAIAGFLVAHVIRKRSPRVSSSL